MTDTKSGRLSPPSTVADIEELLDSIDDQISVWDDDLRLVYANRAVLSWLGRDMDRARGLRYRDIVGDDVAEHAGDFFAAARAEGVVRYGRTLDGPDGRQHALAIRVSSYGRDGGPAGFVILGSDRTAQADAQAAQRDSAQRAEVSSERDRIADELDAGVRGRLLGLLTTLRDAGSPGVPAGAVVTIDDTIATIRRAISRLQGPPMLAEPAPVPVVPRRDDTDNWDARLPAAATEQTASSSWTLDQALAVVDELPGLTAWDTDQVNCFANRPAVLGIGASSRADMIGRTRLELFGPEVEARSRPFAEAAAAGSPQRYDSEFVDGSGTRRSVHFVYYPVCRGATPAGMVALLMDLEPDQPGSDGSVAAVVTDRRRIAEDLHDHVIQHLYAAGLALDSSADDADSAIARATGCLAAAVEALDASVHHLHGSGAGDLADLVAAAVGRAGGALGTACRVDTIGDLAGVPATIGPELVAVLTEALSNAARHADADDVHVTVSVGRHAVWLRVADDGRGIEQNTRSSGLANLANRARRLGGSFTVRANAPRGTVLDWQVPLRS